MATSIEGVDRIQTTTKIFDMCEEQKGGGPKNFLQGIAEHFCQEVLVILSCNSKFYTYFFSPVVLVTLYLPKLCGLTGVITPSHWPGSLSQLDKTFFFSYVDMPTYSIKCNFNCNRSY